MLSFRLMKIGRSLAFLAVIPLVCSRGESVRAEEASLPSTPFTLSKSQPTSSGNVTNRQCRLNFLRKPWPEVLEQVAKETDSVLVMPEAPPGYFSRTDFEKHDREVAVRILNRDLEKVGFRLVASDEKLEVIPAKRKTPEYPRHNVLTEEQQRKLNPLPGDSSSEMGSVKQVAHETTEDEQPAPPLSLTIHPQSRSALDIAKQLHATFKQRSRLENAGPHGLPAFVVEHFNPEAAKSGIPLFTMEIDTTGNELIVTADAGVQAGLKQLIQQIDTNPLQAEATPHLLVGTGNTAEAGQKLREPLLLLAQARAQQPAANPDPGAPPNPGAGPANTDASPPAGLPTLLGNLRGDVSIEALNDLDLLILRGNEKDVEAVMQVIRAVEQMAVGSLPEIHLLRLRFVDSQSLAQLLNDVYARMTELRSNNAQQSQVAVRVVPVVTPNAVLVLAPANAMAAVLQLADELDQPIDPSHEVQIYRLKHAVASSVAELLTSFYTQPPTGLGTRLKVAADPRTNSVIVQARARDLSEVAEFIKGLDSEQAGAVSQLKVFPLKSATAEELATFLNNAIQGVLNPARMSATTGQAGTAATGTANQQARATVLEFLAEGGQELIRSGLLNDIRFNADPRTNSLLVTASEQSMPLVEELIHLLDRPSTALAEIKVFPLKNADATNAAQLLQELFNTSQSQTNQANRTGQAGALGVELLGAEGSGSSLVPLRFSVDARTNSVVAVGGAEALRIVEAILFRLDTNDARNRQTTVIKLRNSPVADVAAAINEFLAAQRELATLDPNRISTSQLLEQEIIVTAEPVTNSLLISATPAYFKQLEELAKKLDAEPPQVVIQAMLVEVSLDNTDEFGVELGFQDPVLFARSAISDLVTTTTNTVVPGVGNVQTTNIISQQAVPGFNFNNQALGGNNGPASASPGTVGTQGLSNFNIGRTNNDLGYGGLVLSASSDAVSVLIRALAARRTVRVLSRPQVIALDNQTAQVQVGQIVPVPNGATGSGTGIINTSVLRDPAGIILTVSPRISPEGQIVMEVAAEKSAYPNLTTGVPIFTDSNGNVVSAPVKDITTARTTVKVPDGQTVVIAGMITKNDLNEERKVPWLGDLPIIGKAFRYDLFQFGRTELLIFLTPRVVHNDADMEMIKQVEAGRMHFFQDDVESVHGPIFGVPHEMSLPIETSPPLDLLPTLPHNVPPAPGLDPNRVPPASSEQPPAPRGNSPAPELPAPQVINPSAGARALPEYRENNAVFRLGEVPAE
jgi:type II secretion system protein D